MRKILFGVLSLTLLVAGTAFAQSNIKAICDVAKAGDVTISLSPDNLGGYTVTDPSRANNIILARYRIRTGNCYFSLENIRIQNVTNAVHFTNPVAQIKGVATKSKLLKSSNNEPFCAMKEIQLSNKKRVNIGPNKAKTLIIRGTPTVEETGPDATTYLQLVGMNNILIDPPVQAGFVGVSEELGSLGAVPATCGDLEDEGDDA